MKELKINIIQIPTQWEDPKKNIQEIENQIVKSESGDIIVLPEMWNTGFSMRPEILAESMEGPSISWMKEQAKILNIAICGSIIINEGGHNYNRFIFAHSDGNIEKYDKRHCFGLAKEDEHFTPGNERIIIKYKDWRICPLICYDLRFPVWSRNQDDYDLLIYVAQFPEKRRQAWLKLLPARAIENVAYVVGVNGIGTDGNGIIYSGDSGVWDYEGNNLLQMNSDIGQDSISLKLDKLKAFRRAYPFLNDRDKFNIL